MSAIPDLRHALLRSPSSSSGPESLCATLDTQYNPRLGIFKTIPQQEDNPLNRPVNIALPILYTIGAPIITVGIRYGTLHYDVYTLSFFRYVAGCAALLLICLTTSRNELIALLRSRRELAAITVLSVVSFLAQTLFLKGLALTSAVLGDLILLLGQPINAVLAVLLFHDEREFARSPVFLVAAALVLAGSFGMIGAESGVESGYSTGIALLIIATVGIAATSLTLKHVTRSRSAWSISAVSSCMMCVLFLIGSMLWGQPSTLFRTSALTNAIVFASGAYGLVMGIGLATLIIKQLGVIAFSFSTLAVPFFTGLLGYLLLGETLTVRQAAFGMLIIAGCGLVFLRMRAGSVRGSAPANVTGGAGGGV